MKNASSASRSSAVGARSRSVAPSRRITSTAPSRMRENAHRAEVCALRVACAIGRGTERSAENPRSDLRPKAVRSPSWRRWTRLERRTAPRPCRGRCAITSELSLDALLQRLVEKAAELTGARYAALGVIDEGGSELEHFITHGDRRADAGGDRRPPPRPRDPRRADPRTRSRSACTTWPRTRARSASRQPPVDALLSRRSDPAPRDAYGNLYLTEKAGGGGLHRRGRGARHAARRPGCGRDRERAPVRGGDELVAAARVAERGRERARDGDRPRPAARSDRPPAARADRRARGHGAPARRRAGAASRGGRG